MYAEKDAFGGFDRGIGQASVLRGDVAPRSVADALRMADAAMDYLNSSAADLSEPRATRVFSPRYAESP